MKIKPFLEFYAYFYEIAPTFSVHLPVRRAAILSPTLRGAVGNGFIRSAECINAFPTNEFLYTDFVLRDSPLYYDYIIKIRFIQTILPP